MTKPLTCQSYDKLAQNALYSALTLAANNYGLDWEYCEYEYLEETPRSSLIVELVAALDELGFEIKEKE